VNGILKEKWQDLSEIEKGTYRDWCEWDKKRYARDMEIFETKKLGGGFEKLEAAHIPKKRKSFSGNNMSVPKKRKR